MRRRFNKVKIFLLLFNVLFITNSVLAYEFDDPRNESKVLELRRQVYTYTEEYYKEFGRDEEFSSNGYYGVCSTVNVDGKTYTLEEYVAGVVAAEVGAESDCPETLKAHAVAARTYLLKTSDCSKPVTNGQSYQAFKETTKDSAYYRAAMATQGQVLTRNGQLILSQYTSYPNAIFQTFDNGGWQIKFQKISNDPSTAWTWSGPSKAEVLSYSHYAPSSGAPSTTHHFGMSTVLATYYANAKGYSYDKILHLFYGDDVKIDTLADGSYIGDLEFVDGGFGKKVYYFNQLDYKDYYYSSNVSVDEYGGATISSHGCGPTSLAIVVSSLKDEAHGPIETTQKVCSAGGCTTGGTDRAYLDKVAQEYGFTTLSVSRNNTQPVIDALSSGNSLVIALMGPGIFTSGGHYIVLTGVNKDKQFAVVDPASRYRTQQKWFDYNTVVEQSKADFLIISKKVKQ